MPHASWFKSPDVIVLRQESDNGLYLLRRESGKFFVLDEQWTPFWETWRPERLESILPELMAAGMVCRGQTSHPPQCTFDSVIPKIASPNLKWYAESSDMWILFNTETLQVWALGPCGSLCWRQIVAGHSVGQMRMEWRRIFGEDGLPSFLEGLTAAGCVEPVDGLHGAVLESAHRAHQFCVPGIHLWLSHSRIPWSCDWELNTVCNLRCKHCYLPNHVESGLNTEAAIRTADQIIDTGIPFVTLLGGEILLRDDIEKIVARLRAAGVFVSIVSNGLLLTMDRARALAAAGLNRLLLSLDGLDEQVHDNCRGRGTFIKTLQSLQCARSAGVSRIAIIWTVHTNNIFQLDILPAFAQSLGVSEFCIDLFKRTGELGGTASFEALDKEMIRRIQASISSWRQIHPTLSVNFEPNCTCGRTRVTIGSDGYARLCTFDDRPVAEVGGRPLIDIWRAMSPGLPVTGPLGYCASKSRRLSTQHYMA
jgi:MoaA/NifB/PqqE/SkfB family radical SAM enzyme